MSFTAVNEANLPNGNLTGNTLTTETYRAAAAGLLLQNFDGHDHSSGKGLAVARIQSGLDANKPAGGTSAGVMYIATDTGVVYYDDGTDLDVLGTLDNAQTWSGANTYSANVIFNALWSDAAQVSVASAATFALPTTGNNVNVTGTTGITDFSGPATQGVIYKLQFTNASPGSVTSGNHAKLNGNFSPAQNNILYLYWDGTNAWEIGRYTASAGAKKLGSGTATTNQSIISTTSPGTDITGLSVTCTPDGTHDVQITVSLPNTASDSGAVMSFALQKDGVIVNTYTYSNSVGVPRLGVCLVHVDPTPTNASHTYKMSAWTSANTLSTINGDGTSPTNTILVEQLG